MRAPLLALVPALALCAVAAHAAGTVEVSFKPVTELADAGSDRHDGERNVARLSDHLRTLAARLPDGQALKVEVTDLDLAGQMRPTRRGGDIRVLNGRADWPSLTLRWSLAAGGRTLAEGNERIADMAYQLHPLRGADDRALGYELRLIDRWFEERVLTAAAR